MTTKGMHCVRYKDTSAGKRCAEFEPHFRRRSSIHEMSEIYSKRHGIGAAVEVE